MSDSVRHVLSFAALTKNVVVTPPYGIAFKDEVRLDDVRKGTAVDERSGSLFVFTAKSWNDFVGHLHSPFFVWMVPKEDVIFVFNDHSFKVHLLLPKVSLQEQVDVERYPFVVLCATIWNTCQGMIDTLGVRGKIRAKRPFACEANRSDTYVTTKSEFEAAKLKLTGTKGS